MSWVGVADPGGHQSTGRDKFLRRIVGRGPVPCRQVDDYLNIRLSKTVDPNQKRADLQSERRVEGRSDIMLTAHVEQLGR